MTIKIKVSELLGKHKMSQKELAEKTGIRAATVSALYHEQIKRIDLDQIDKICKIFNCSPGEIFEYIDDDSVSKSNLTLSNKKNYDMTLENSPRGMIVKSVVAEQTEDYSKLQDRELIKNYVEEIILEILQQKYKEKK